MSEKKTGALMTLPVKQIAEVMNQNLSGMEITAFDFDKVKIPAGGGKMWAVPTLDGEHGSAKIEGVVMHFTTPRAYWQIAFDDPARQGSSPPDCSSQDGRFGEGDPGGRCSDCVLNKFGSAEKGGGKACREMVLLFVMLPERFLPTIVALPATSIKAWKQYSMRLASNGIASNAVLTSIGLEQDKSEGGITYSKATFALAGKLEPSDVSMIAQLRDALVNIMSQVTIDMANTES